MNKLTDHLTLRRIIGHMTVALASKLAEEISAEEQLINIGKLTDAELEQIEAHVLRTLHKAARGEEVMS